MDGTASTEPEFSPATPEQVRSIQERMAAIDAEVSPLDTAPDPNVTFAQSVATLVAAGYFGDELAAPTNRAQARAIVGGSNRKRGARKRAFARRSWLVRTARLAKAAA